MKTRSLIGAASAAFFAASGSLYRYVFYRSRSRLSEKLLTPKTHSEEFYRSREEAAKAMDSHTHEVISMKSENGYDLNGFYYRAGSERSKKVCFMVHGYRGNHTNNAGPFIQHYLDLGIDVFSDDHVACGSSGGHLISYDIRESEDLLQWLKLLRRYCGHDVQIVLHGFSLGGATVLKICDQCPDNVKLIVSDSGYTSAKDVIVPNLPILQKWIDAMNYFVTGHRLEETDVRYHVGHTSLPIVFMHGEEDETVPVELAKELYENCSSPDKHLFTVYNARHVEAEYVDPDGYYMVLDEYLHRYLLYPEQ